MTRKKKEEKQKQKQGKERERDSKIPRKLRPREETEEGNDKNNANRKAPPIHQRGFSETKNMYFCLHAFCLSAWSYNLDLSSDPAVPVQSPLQAPHSHKYLVYAFERISQALNFDLHPMFFSPWLRPATTLAHWLSIFLSSEGCVDLAQLRDKKRLNACLALKHWP